MANRTAQRGERTLVELTLVERVSITGLSIASRVIAGCMLVGVVIAGCAEEPAPSGVDCGAHPSCGVEGPECSDGRSCIAVDGCSSAICIATEQACRETCGASSCALLESFPLQIACQGRDPMPGHGGDSTCDELEGDRAAELAAIQSCSSDDECGLELVGTSCGCTRNLVARVGADATRFSRLQAALNAAECGGFISTCDCPAADGFACAEGRCTWNYVDASESVAP